MSTLNLPPAAVPPSPSLKSLREAVRDCRACDPWEGATQAVMGEGAVKHLNYKLRGKRHIHQKPDRWQVAVAIEERLGPIDVWINNAMTTVFAFLDDIDAHEYEVADLERKTS
jgi:hypothetical protein